MSENKQQSETCIAIKDKSQGRAVMHLRRGGIFITLQSHSTAGHLLRTFLSSQYLCSSTSDAFGNYVLCKLIFYDFMLHYMTHLLLSLPLKEFSKSASIWQRQNREQEYSGTFLLLIYLSTSKKPCWEGVNITFSWSAGPVQPCPQLVLLCQKAALGSVWHGTATARTIGRTSHWTSRLRPHSLAHTTTNLHHPDAHESTTHSHSNKCDLCQSI